MQAGNELDGIVAEKVMEWKGSYQDRNIEMVAWRDVRSNIRSFNGGEDPEDQWCPSTYISDAWLVLEKMQEKWSWDMILTNEANEVEVRIGRGRHTSASVPLAICLAALDAIEKSES